jgi:Flp pilus assembly protein TadD
VRRDLAANDDKTLRMRSKRPRNGLRIAGAIVLVGLAGYFGHHWYVVLREAHLIREARQFLAVSDRKNALLCLERALASDARDPNACRLMADLAEAMRSPSALIWRSRVVEYNPGSLDDRLALAETAMNARDYATAASTLEGVDQPGKRTVDYHNVAGALAAATGQPAQAEAHFREVARLDPTNMLPLLNIAVLRIRSTNDSDLAEARSFLRSLASNPTNSSLRWNALRELTVDAMRFRETNSALMLSQELLQQTNSVFSDKLLRLDLLADTGNPEFRSVLAAVQRDAAGDPATISELASWQLEKTPPGEVLAWLRSLPVTTQHNQTVAMLTADCFNSTGDWRGLQDFLKPQNWGELEFIRHAFLGRALRGQELTDSAKEEWEQALKEANGRKQNLIMLLRLAAKWNWSSEAEELLGTIVNQYPQEKWASEALTQTLFAQGRTRSLLQLFSHEAALDPSNLTFKNDVALMALLLNAQELKPHELAREVYGQSPTNSVFASTYALSLLLQKKNAEALKVMESLDPQVLQDPTFAGFYGLALQAIGNGAKAKIYLDLGLQAPMLPEHRKLLEKANGGA